VPGCTTLEGPKFYQRNGWYYVFAPAGGVATGWQSVFRAKNLRGPYEHRIVLAQGGSPINGPHQGALVDTPAGDWWFLHFQDKGAYGRIVHLQPVLWRDDWPLMGTGVATGAETGEPVLVHAKPALPLQPPAVTPTSDEFDAPTLGLQWQWQANPAADWHSLTARTGWLRLFAQPEPAPGNLYDAPHLLLQKFPAEEFTATVTLEFVPKHANDSAGLMVFGYDYAWIGLRLRQGVPTLVLSACRDAAQGSPQNLVELSGQAPAGPVWLRVTVTAGAQVRLAWSLDGETFTAAGEPFTATVGRWVGAKLGVFAAGTPGSHADFDWIRFAPPLPQ
jgi:beta-xylosidase